MDQDEKPLLEPQSFTDGDSSNDSLKMPIKRKHFSPNQFDGGNPSATEQDIGQPVTTSS